MTTKIGLSASSTQRISGNAADFSEQNPILGNGEIGSELDTNMIKIGDGVTAYADLPYLNQPTTTQSPAESQDSTYTLPAASTSTLGGVKLGAHFFIDNNDVLTFIPPPKEIASYIPGPYVDEQVLYKQTLLAHYLFPQNGFAMVDVAPLQEMVFTIKVVSGGGGTVYNGTIHFLPGSRDGTLAFVEEGATLYGFTGDSGTSITVTAPVIHDQQMAGLNFTFQVYPADW